MIVEDQMLVALDLEEAVSRSGLEVVAIAGDRDQAMSFADNVEIAFVDLNLRDGNTGTAIGRDLASRGVKVIFMTANPSYVRDGVEGTVGLLQKPVSDQDMAAAVRYAAGFETLPPACMVVFGQSNFSRISELAS